MISSNYICCWDLETSGLSWENDESVQVACIMIDPYKLEVIKGSEFNSLMKPVNIFTGTDDEINEKWDRSKKAWDTNKKTKEQLKDAPLPEHVWKAFANHLK